MRVAFAGIEPDPLQHATGELRVALACLGHEVQNRPTDDTDLLLTGAHFGQVLPWREALLFSARRRFGLRRAPTVVCMVLISPKQLDAALAGLAQALNKIDPGPTDFTYPGLAPQSWHVLLEQGRRGGPILSLARLIQAQCKAIRLILLVADQDEILGGYYLDLVGSHPYVGAADRQGFYHDMALRLNTAVSTCEVTDHQMLEPPITAPQWAALATPGAMRRAGLELGKRGFFTEMVRIGDLIHVPAVSRAIASQYSEGCYATWDVSLGGLVSTVTGSARPIDKFAITDDDLAVIVGVRPDGRGAMVRLVAAKADVPPSSEAVEMMAMDALLPQTALSPGLCPVPVVRSKLHGHRGLSAYDPQRVEFVRLAPAYYHYPVSCATEAQAREIAAAFSRAECLNCPSDRRQVAFTILPGHGIVLCEKWAADKEPFQLIWEYMDAGYLQLTKSIPQGLVRFQFDGQRMCIADSA
jgi:hypothetical protein